MYIHMLASAVVTPVTPLLDPDTVAALSGDVVILDATTHLATPADGMPYTVHPDHEGFLAGHVPGARFADLASDLSDPAGRFAFTLPSSEAFAAAAGALGIGDGTHVVVYDNAGMVWATRVWWLLRVFGHDRVSVLDGGLRAWREAGHPIETDEAAAPPATTFTARFRRELVADKIDVAALSSSAGTLVCALDAATFRGESEVTPYSRRGRIPGSSNVPHFRLIDRASGKLLDRDRLAEKLQGSGLLDADRAVTYCGGGIAATLPAFAAYLLTGAEVAVYDGSLSEWTADPEMPLEVG
ncbi:sulfurtransferase [Pseudonocardia parietis]|uniref:Thiosulfate/3-mercaptopyruvate sulfurtransferase n=1 Tax=Pseudonocardia parietis TaxID=570936 RepID=A0ABS4VSG3_9PSEU|nr:rhodanese-like domain-containing protein [Pseudonocardia parietis]MBP2366872.1 thiosulfate/3-mercaptopyruvate sulfurtransferase [Pseudonocardia parietis]